MSRLHVRLVTSFYPPESFGGDGIHVQRLARALARRGHHVDVLCSRDAYAAARPRGRARRGSSPPPGADHPNVTVTRFASPVGRLAALATHQLGRPVFERRRLVRLLQSAGRGDRDVVHYHNVSLLGGVGAFAHGEGVKLFTAHEYWIGCPTHMLFRYDAEICRRRTCIRCTLKSGRPPQWWRYTGLVDRSLRHLDAIIAPSRLTAEVYADLGVRCRTVVVPHFLPDEYVSAADSRGARDTTAPPYCLFVGRLDPIKGLEPVVRFFASGAVRVPLWIAGDGPLGKRLGRLAAGSEHVRFLGHRSQEELGPLYRDALALLLPSAGYEVFGQVVLEAFAHGTPAIVSAVGGMRELVDASGGGFVFQRCEQIAALVERLADDQHLRDELGDRGRRHVGSAHAESDYVRRYEGLVAP